MALLFTIKIVPLCVKNGIIIYNIIIQTITINTQWIWHHQLPHRLQYQLIKLFIEDKMDNSWSAVPVHPNIPKYKIEAILKAITMEIYTS